MNTIFSEINEYIEDSLRINSNNAWNTIDFSESDIHTLYQLNSFCAMFSQTILVMLSNDIFWECENLMRTISEGSIKLLYICSDEEIIKEKIQQYREELSNYAFNKDNTRATDFVEKVNNLDDVTKHMLLSLDEFTIHLTKIRKDRKQIEQKWSYIEMVNQIIKMSLPFSDELTGLIFGYGLSSHFVHADFEAIGLISDRANRDIHEQTLLQEAHKSKLLGDIISMALIRAWILYKIGDGNKEEYIRFAESYQSLMKKISALSKPWKVFYKNNYM